MKSSLDEFVNEFTWGKAVAENAEDEFHANFEKAIEEAKNEFGKKYPNIINGKEVFSEECFEVRSPANRDIVLAHFPQGTKQTVQDAIDAAKNAFEKWSSTPYQERVKIFQECADVFSMQKFYHAAIMTFENGKNRIEAINDVDEAIDFMRFYAYQLEKNEGFCKSTPHPNPKEKTSTIMKPFGVWGIIAPFNFPSAIAIGMTSGALLTHQDSQLASFQLHFLVP